MNDNKGRIKRLRQQINELSPMIKEELDSLNSKSTPIEIMVAKTNAQNLENRKKELSVLLAQAQENEIELHITGEDIDVGSAPADTIADVIKKFQALLRYVNTPGKLTDSIRHATNLRLVAFAPGSFRVRMAGPIIDNDLFETDESLDNNYIFRKNVNDLFNLISNPEDETTLDNLKEKNSRFIRAYYEYAHTASKRKINIDTTWFTQKGAITQRMSTAQFKFIEHKLNESLITQNTKKLIGRFTALNSTQKTFTFHVESEQTTISGKYGEFGIEHLREYRVSPFDNIFYEITVDKITDVLKQKTTYHLLDLIPQK